MLCPILQCNYVTATHTISTFLTSFTILQHSRAKRLQNEKSLDQNLKNLNFQEFLENSQEISLLDLDLEAFSFHFSFSKRVNQIFSSLFTSRKKWKRFIFHFSLLEKSEPDFYFTFHFSEKVKEIYFSLSLLELSIPTLAGHDDNHRLLIWYHQISSIW